MPQPDVNALAEVLAEAEERLQQSLPAYLEQARHRPDIEKMLIQQAAMTKSTWLLVAELARYTIAQHQGEDHD